MTNCDGIFSGMQVFRDFKKWAKSLICDLEYI